MMPLGALALGVAPGLFWLWFFYTRDKLEPEPKSLVLRMYFLGMLGVVPAFFLEAGLEGHLFFSMVILAPVLEELIKFLMVVLFVYRDKEFNEPMDGIVYSAAVALGFASAENPLYILDAFPLSGANIGMAATPEFWDDFWRIFVIRAILTVPGHALWSSIWGYALGRAKFMSTGGDKVVALGLLGGILFHALHNFAAVYVSSYASLGILFAVALVFWIIVRKNIQEALAASPFAPGKRIIETQPEAQPETPAEDLSLKDGALDLPTNTEGNDTEGNETDAKARDK